MSDGSRVFGGRAPQLTRGLPQAVLFDMDGTIVDTEPYWIAAEYRLVDSFGGAWNDEQAHELVGNELLTSADYLRAHGGVELDRVAIVDRLQDDVVEATSRAVPWRPGAVELIGALRGRGVSCALVTMSYERLARVVVDRLPPGTFDAVVTGDQVRRGKPDPEAYRTAAQRLGVDPGDCVAIEDSPTGVASALAAGCAVIAVPHHVPIEPAAGLTIVASLRDVTAGMLESVVSAKTRRDSR